MGRPLFVWIEWPMWAGIESRGAFCSFFTLADLRSGWGLWIIIEEECSVAKGKFQRWLTPDGLLLLEAWARDGLSNEQIAKNIGVNPDTLYTWKNRFSEIAEALSRGKEPVDIEVENALHRLALGYTVKLQKTFKVKRVYFDEAGRRCEKEELVTGYDEEHVPANVIAQKFWLSNRKPDVWRDKREVEAGAQSLEAAKELLGGVASAIE